MTDFRILAQMSSDALLAVNGAGRIVYANPAAQRLLAPASAGLQGQHTSTLWHPDPFDGTPQAPDGSRPLHVQLHRASGSVTALQLTITRDGASTADDPTYYLRARPHSEESGLPDRLRTALALSTDAAMVVDARTLAFLDVNPAACALLGRDRAAVLASGPIPLRRRDGAHVEDFHRLYADLIDHAPQALTIEYDFTAADGRTIPISATRQALSVDGRWLIFVTWRDISERVAAQVQVQQLKDAFDQTADAINIVDIDSLGYVDVNEAAARLHGVTREELRAMGVRGAFPGRFDEAGLRARYDELIALSPQSRTEERQIPRRDGVVVWAESIRRAIQVDGEWLVISVMRDITDRKAAQARLAQFKAAFDQSSEAVAIVDIDAMAYIYNNDANLRLLGVSREEMDRLSPPEVARRLGDTSDTRAFFAQLVASYPSPNTREFSYARADGGVVHYSVRHQAMHSDGGWFAISTKTDITARKQANRQLELLDTAINAAPDAIQIIDASTLEYISVNEASAQLVGMPREQMLAKGIAGVFQNEPERERLRGIYAKVIGQSPMPDTEVHPLRLPSGNVAMIEATRRAVRVDGRWVIVSVNRDVTERLAARARMELFAAAVSLSTDAVLVIRRHDMRIVEVNDAACRMYRYSREGLLALPPHSNKVGGTADNLTALYDETIRASPAISRADIMAIRGDGTLFPAEAQRCAIQVNGEWIVVITVRDLTQQKDAQARQALLTAAIEAAPDGIAVVDPDTLQYIHANEAACRTHGVSREELMARGVDGMFSGQMSAPDIRALYANVIRSHPQAITEERTIVAADGTAVVYEAVRRAVRVDNRWLIISMNRDVSERKAAQARLELMHQAINAAPDAIVVIDPATLEYKPVPPAKLRIVMKNLLQR